MAAITSPDVWAKLAQSALVALNDSTKKRKIQKDVFFMWQLKNKVLHSSCVPA